jgi:hypothetical protein
MNDETRARARAQYFGPEMLNVISKTVERIENEIREAKALSDSEVTALLLSLAEPLREVRDKVEIRD